jgi:hypothetical protein
VVKPQRIRGRRGGRCVNDPHAEDRPTLLSPQLFRALPHPLPHRPATPVPLRRRAAARPEGNAAVDRVPAPPEHHPGAANLRPLTVVAAPRCGKEHAAPVSCPLPPLRECIPLVTMTPCRPPPWGALTRALIIFLERLEVFTASCSTSRARPRPEWRPDGRDRPTPAKRHRGSRAPATPRRSKRR